MLGDLGGAFDGGGAGDDDYGVAAPSKSKPRGGDWLIAPSRDLSEYDACPSAATGGATASS